MVELLILIVLLDGKSSIYGIKQKIESKFSLFSKVSFGSLHPALKKLEDKKFVAVKAAMSSGGQKKSSYSITNSGKDRFKSLMLENLPDNQASASQIINIKLMALQKLDIEDQKILISSIIRYLELYKINAENLFNNIDAKDKLHKSFIKHNIAKISEDIQWINSLL